MHQLVFSRARTSKIKAKPLLAISSAILGLALGIGSLKDGMRLKKNW